MTSDVAMPTVPGAGLIVVEAQLVFRGLEAVFDRPTMSLDLDQHLDAGSGRAPSREEGQVSVGDVARISRPRVHRPLRASSYSAASRSASSQYTQSCSRAPLVPSPADKRCHRDGSMAPAISSAVPATGGLRCQERK